MDRYSPGWTSYFFTGTLALVLSWAMTGCKFGNNPGGFIREASAIDLFFETEPASLTHCAILEGESDPTCGDLDVARIPAWTTQLVSNPVGVQLQSNSSTEAKIFNALVEEPYGLSTIFDQSTGAFGFDEEYEADPYWFNDGSCMSSFILSHGGSVSTYEQSKEMSGRTVIGRLGVDFVVLTNFQGAGCAQAFTEIQNCLVDTEQCGESSPEADQSLHDSIVATFSPYIDSGALAVDDFHRIVTLGYQVSYR